MAKTPTIKALLSFKKYKDDVLVTFALYVLSCLSGNAFFPSVATYLADLKLLQSNFNAAYELAKSGNRKDIAAKDNARAALLDHLMLITQAINLVAINNKQWLLSSGLPITADSSDNKAAEPRIPVVTYTYYGNGSIEIKVKNLLVRAGIVYQVALEGSVNDLDGGPSWLTIPCGKNVCIVKDLPVGKKVLMRVGVWNATTETFYTETVVRMVA